MDGEKEERTTAKKLTSVCREGILKAQTTVHFCVSLQSHPARVRGLKWDKVLRVRQLFQSHPSRVRGLKCRFASAASRRRCVAPRASAHVTLPPLRGVEICAHITAVRSAAQNGAASGGCAFAKNFLPQAHRWPMATGRKTTDRPMGK